MKINLCYLFILVLSCLNTVRSISRNLGRNEKYETNLGLYVHKVYSELRAFNNMIDNQNLELNDNSIHPGFNDYSKFIIHGY